MRHKGYDLFIGKSNSDEEKYCGVCGVKCEVRRNVYGPTGFVSAMAKSFTHHDLFICPNSDHEWHEQGLKLILAIEDTPSKRLADLMMQDLDELLKEHTVQGPTKS
ncbi:MAG: hypothetical protein ACUZ8E_05490 [Candidatus Anammoxibacter sp.]